MFFAPKAKPNTSPPRTNVINPLQEKSAVAAKTLAETLKTNEEKVRAAVKEINNELENFRAS